MDQSTYPQTKQAPGTAIASMVLGIVSIVLIFFAIVTGIIAIVLGANSIKKIRKEPDKYEGEGFAIAGIILGSIGLAFWVIFAIVWGIIGIVASAYL